MGMTRTGDFQMALDSLMEDRGEESEGEQRTGIAYQAMTSESNKSAADKCMLLA